MKIDTRRGEGRGKERSQKGNDEIHERRMSKNVEYEEGKKIIVVVNLIGLYCVGGSESMPHYY